MDSTLSWIIGIGVLLLLIVQATVFVGLYFLARRIVTMFEQVTQLQTKAEYVLNNAEPVLKMAHGLIIELKESADYFSQGMQNLYAITEMAKDEAAEVRSLFGDTTALARREIERTHATVDKVQKTLSVATDQFEQTTLLVQQSVLQPAREFSYIMFGVRRALEVLMAGNRLPVNRVYQDEEMFI